MMSSAGYLASASSRSRFQALTIAVDDALLQALLDRRRALLDHVFIGLALGEQRHVRMERIVAGAPPVEDQIFGRLDLRGRDLVQRVDLGRVQDGAGQAALAGVVEEHRVEHVARRRVQAEADVRQAEDDLDLGELGGDPLDPVEGLEAEAAVVLVAGADGEGQRVDQQIVAGHAVRLGERH